MPPVFFPAALSKVVASRAIIINESRLETSIRRVMRSRFGLDVRILKRVVGAAAISLVLVSPALAADKAALAKDLAALKSGDEKSRVAAIDSLGQLGPEAASATEALAAQLTDESPTVRAHAAHALMQIGPAAVGAAPALAKAISDPDFHVRRISIAALETIHPDPAVVVEALGKALEDADPSVRVAALGTLTEYSDAAVPVLGRALENKDTRYWAALALGELGPSAKDAVPSLTKALADERSEVRREVLIARTRGSVPIRLRRCRKSRRYWKTATSRWPMPLDLPWAALGRAQPAPPTPCARRWTARTTWKNVLTAGP